MNIASVIGPVDVFSAFVAVAIILGSTIFATAMTIKWQNRHKIDQDFELARYRIEVDAQNIRRAADKVHETELAKLAMEKDIQIRRIETGMIDVKAAKHHDK